MSEQLEHYYKRVAFCNDKHDVYVESTDRVNCKDHGWVAYDWFQYKNDQWMKVCCRCAQTVFPEIKPAVKAADLAPCHEIQCKGHSVKDKVCIHCHGKFCLDHMSGQNFCNACDEELDSDESIRFHGC